MRTQSPVSSNTSWFPVPVNERPSASFTSKVGTASRVLRTPWKGLSTGRSPSKLQSRPEVPTRSWMSTGPCSASTHVSPARQ